MLAFTQEAEGALMTSTLKDRIRRAITPIRVNARALMTVAIAAVLTAACDVHGISAPGTLASITVTPNTTMIAGSTQQMVAVGYDAEGRVVTITPTWTVARSGGSVASSGMFTAGVVTGLFANTVVATVGNISGNASITVTAGALATITVVPTPVTLSPTATQQFTAIGKDISGNIVSFTPTWSVVANGGTVDQNGIFTAGNTPGTYTNTVQASNGAVRGYATVIVTVGPLASITVTPNPDTLISNQKQQFVATGKDAGGNPVVIAATWSVVAGGGTTDGAGLFTAGTTLGTYTNTMKATSGSMSGTATVVVKLGPLALITVTPNPALMVISTTQQMAAVGTDVGGNIVPITPIWDVVTTGNGASITTLGLYNSGTLTGTFPGKVRATFAGISGLATIIVTAGPLASITVTPTPVVLPYNTLQLYTAVGRDASNNIFIIKPVWSVVNGGGVIDTLGRFTSGAVAGTYLGTVKATSGLIFGVADVTVSAPLPPPPSDPILGVAAVNGIMAGVSVTCSGTGVINADITISPGSTVSGFPPCTRTGLLTLAPSATALAAQNALTAAYNTLMGMSCPAGNAIAADLGGTTKTAGVYCSGSSVSVTGPLTLDGGGNANAVFVFQAGSTLTGAGSIVLIGGAQAKNVYWVVGSSATLNASAWQGNIVAFTSISLNVNSTMSGRALARNGSVTLDASANVITLP
jgi:hypothetical protein